MTAAAATAAAAAAAGKKKIASEQTNKHLIRLLLVSTVPLLFRGKTYSFAHRHFAHSIDLLTDIHFHKYFSNFIESD